MEAALEALSTIGPDGVVVTDPASWPKSTYKVIFEGSLAETDVPQIQGENGTIPLGYDHSKRSPARLTTSDCYE